MAMVFEDDKVLRERFCQVMAETITIRQTNIEKVEWGIFPYGYQGEIACKLLYDKFGIKPNYIIDNKWSKFNPNIISLETLAKIDHENLVVFISSDRNDIYDEIRAEINSYITKGTVVDLFYMVNEDNDRKVEAVRLLAKYFYSVGIDGSVAEAGVRDGAFAKYINKYFFTKKLYLFDTFEGFHHELVKKNMVEEDRVFMANMDYKGYHHENRGGIVPMPYPENIIIKKGFFPETALDVEDIFCYVHLDMDIYQSTVDGLEFFWPKMVERGIIMIDDYYNDHCPGVKKAVDEFCSVNGIGVCFLPEYRGTAVLTKNR